MGMTCTLRRLPEGELERLLALSPDDASAFLRAKDEEASAAAGLEVRRVQPRNVVLRVLLRLLPVTVEEVVPRPGAPAPGDAPSARATELDLEGVWEGLHFLLTGTAWEGDEPACYLVRGGRELGDGEDEDVRVLLPADVRRFSEHLATLSRDALALRHDPPRMAALRIRTVPVAHVLDAFDELRTYVGDAATAGDGLLVRLG